MVYPNIANLAAITQKYIGTEYKKKLDKLNRRVEDIELDVIMFPQVWANTAIGFDMNAKNEIIEGSPIPTKAYTTVIYNIDLDLYYVFFDNRFCYKVVNPSHKFFEDLRNNNLKGLSKYKYYKGGWDVRERQVFESP